MREIKFRAWDKDAETMVFQSESGGEYCWHIDVEEIWIENIVEDYTSKIELMQYTGLKDKDGVEIYEGDILNYGHYKNSHKVIYRNACFWGESIERGDPIGIGLYNALEDLEVTGNIYENPELLEVQNG